MFLQFWCALQLMCRSVCYYVVHRNAICRVSKSCSLVLIICSRVKKYSRISLKTNPKEPLNMLFLAGVCINQIIMSHDIIILHCVTCSGDQDLQTSCLLEKREQGFFNISVSRLTDGFLPGLSFVCLGRGWHPRLA